MPRVSASRGSYELVSGYSRITSGHPWLINIKRKSQCKMLAHAELLTRILKGIPAVDAKPERAHVVKVGRKDSSLWFISVRPRHEDFWCQFRHRYPQWREIAERYGATRGSMLNGGWCPEFHQLESLMNWLTDTLGLPRSVRNLLLIEANSDRLICWIES